MGLFNKKELKRIAELEEQLKSCQEENLKINADLRNKLAENEKYMRENGITDCMTASAKLAAIEKSIEIHTESDRQLLQKIDSLNNDITLKTDQLNDLDEKIKKNDTTLNNLKVKIKNLRQYSKEIQEAIKAYHAYEDDGGLTDELIEKFQDLVPTVTIKLNALDVKDLRKSYRENEKRIEEILKAYESRYTTKANQTIYKLMVIGLKAELQNTLSNLRYDKEAQSIDYIHGICEKYRVISSEGNQSIAKTVNRFIAEIEILFNEAIHIEYEYYVKKERERAEQAAIREQMRQEAAERKELERQRKQVEKEESKFTTEIDNVRTQLATETDQNAIDKLNQKIAELQAKLEKVSERKEDIINRQNGKAGNVYVISNLGSFGDDVFKVGMTRRLEPMDRVRELGDASVPFGFDVHAMIFSEDAVALESKLHQILDRYRLNKVNLRKEFFKVSLDEIEKVVLQEDPAAAFNRTMLAEQYRQSLSIEEDEEENTFSN